MSRGQLVTLDGPGGAGKSTLLQLVTGGLEAAGVTVHATTEPSHGPAGQLARDSTAIFHGHALACLVAADRYHHLETEIEPALDAGKVVICDRYVPSSYALQVLDGVDQDFVAAINAHAPSGHLDEDETIVDGAAREAHEEVGVRIDSGDLRLVAVVHHRQRADLARVGMFFATGRWDGEPYNAEPHKCGKLLWCDPSVLPSNTIDYPATGIASYLSDTPFTVHNW